MNRQIQLKIGIACLFDQNRTQLATFFCIPKLFYIETHVLF